MISYAIEAGVLTGFCGNDSRMVIPDGVREIADGVFFGQEFIRELVLPESVKRLGDHAFQECTGLEKLTIAAKDISIGSSCFCLCDSLKELHIDPAVRQLGEQSFAGCRALAGKDGYLIVNKHLFGYFGPGLHMKIPEGVEVLGKDFCWKTGWVVDVELPGSLRVMEGSCLSRCGRLRRIVVPKNVERIGKDAFALSFALEEIRFEGSRLQLDRGALDYLPAWCRVSAPNAPLSLFPPKIRQQLAKDFAEALARGETFDGKLEKENHAVIRRQRRLFYPSALESEALLGYMLRDGMLPLADADELLRDDRCSDEARLALLDYRRRRFSEAQRKTQYEKELGLRAMSATELHRLWRTKKLPDGSLSIGGCRARDKNIVIPEKIGNAAVTAIDDLAFSPHRGRLSEEDRAYYAAGLRTVTVPDGVTSIGVAAFYDCETLQTVYLPGTVREIGDYAFSGTGMDFVLCSPGNKAVREYAERNGLGFMG